MTKDKPFREDRFTWKEGDVTITFPKGKKEPDKKDETSEKKDQTTEKKE